MGVVKLLITLSSFSLILFLLLKNVSTIPFNLLISSATSTENLLWGILVVIFSLISFTTVTPDFFSQLKTKKDSLLTILFGLIIPGVFITILGAMLFFNQTELSFEVLIGIGGISLLGYIFNILTNTDASIAIYTPGNRIEYMFKIKFKLALLIATILGTLVALADIKANLENWLKVLGIVYPIIVLITLVFYYLIRKDKNIKK